MKYLPYSFLDRSKNAYCILQVSYMCTRRNFLCKNLLLGCYTYLLKFIVFIFYEINHFSVVLFTQFCNGKFPSIAFVIANLLNVFLHEQYILQDKYNFIQAYLWCSHFVKSFGTTSSMFLFKTAPTIGLTHKPFLKVVDSTIACTLELQN